jgi:hypothetical protein
MMKDNIHWVQLGGHSKHFHMIDNDDLYTHTNTPS